MCYMHNNISKKAFRGMLMMGPYLEIFILNGCLPFYINIFTAKHVEEVWRRHTKVYKTVDS